MAMNVTWTAYTYPNITGLYDSAVYFNLITGGWFGLSIIASTWAILFLVFMRWGVDKAAPSASFVTLLMALALRASGLISDSIIILLIILIPATILLLGKK